MMKCVQYDRRFLNRRDDEGKLDVIQPNIYAICESNEIDKNAIDYFCNDDLKLKNDLEVLTKELVDAKEYGSILVTTNVDFERILERFAELKNEISIYNEYIQEKLYPLIMVGMALAQQYDVVVTNPPYMAVSNSNAKLNTYIKKNYPDSKADLFAVFMERCNRFTKNHGIYSMITQHAWMFLGSYEKLRDKVRKNTILSLAHLGAHAFEEIGGEVVQTAAFSIKKDELINYKGTYIQLTSEMSQDEKEHKFLSGEGRYIVDQSDFEDIPGAPISYWVTDKVRNAFLNNKSLGEVASPKQGLATTDNNRFVRFWYEVDFKKIGFGYTSNDAKESGLKWFPLNKGGEFRKWYGNNDCIVNYQNDGAEIKANVLKKYTYLKTPDFVVKNQSFYFKENGTWSAISSGDISVRYSPRGFVISNAGMAIFSENDLKYIIAFMNSKCISGALLKAISQTLNYNAGDIEKIPFIIDESRKSSIEKLADECITIAKEDWDSFEISWDFKIHPLIKYHTNTIREAFDIWEKECNERINKLKEKEELINKAFIDIYDLSNEIDPSVELGTVMASSRPADLKRDIKGLISYAVGCMFGRYSLDKGGLVMAGEEFEENNYNEFSADADGIIPICDDDYFADDITGLFINFIATVYGKDKLEENLSFIANVLGGKGSAKEVIRNYFLNDFYQEHIKTYQKRPIYWLFDSGKKGGFKCLIYVHRYKADTIARIRTDYVHEQQSRYHTAIEDVEKRMLIATGSDKIKLSKSLKHLKEQEEEIHSYEEKIHHLADQMISIDLDDGVKDNYSKFKDVLAKIK